MSYTLVVVDMQDTFSAANDARVRLNCSKEITKAMSAKAAIIFVEYSGQGPTLPGLTNLTIGYDLVFTTIKSGNDGSREVESVINDNDLPNDNIKVIGVNTDYCVLETVFGLSENMDPAKLQVIANACWSDYDHHHGLERMSEVSTIIR